MCKISRENLLKILSGVAIIAGYNFKKVVLQIRDVYPGSDCLLPGSRIRIKEFKYFNPQKTKKMVFKL
jgi:hypothetical protein